MTRARSYDDEALAAAIRDCTSWRGVLRALGLAATSSAAIRSVRRRADELGVDHTHFTGGRSWTDVELRDAVAGSTSWSEVVESLGLVHSSGPTLRGHAARLGLNVAHLTRRPRAEHPGRLALAPDLSHLSRAGSSMAASWFQLCGAEVSWPLEPCRYDLIVRAHMEIFRVQVKTATRRDGDSWIVWLSTTGRTRTVYEPTDVDHFFIVDGDLACYLIPLEAVGGLHAIHLSAYLEYRVPTASAAAPDTIGHRRDKD